MPLQTKSRYARLTTLLCVLCLIVLGGCSGNQKVTFCHHPPGNPGNPQTLTVSVKSLSSIANEELDYQGECLEQDNGSGAIVDNSANECSEDGLCGEFNYTYGVSDDPETGSINQFYEISTNFENTVNESHKISDSGNDIGRFETGVGVDTVNTDYIDRDGLPSGKNISAGEVDTAIILGE